MQDQGTIAAKQDAPDGATTNGAASVWDLPVPEGYLRDAQGRLVHSTQVSEADGMRHKLITETVLRALGEAETTARFFDEVHAELLAFCALSAERFGTAWGETDSFSMTSLCGRFKVACDCDQGVALNESIATAKALLDECIADWMQGGKPQAAALVKDTFRAGKNGAISLGRLFSLLRHRTAEAFAEDERFQRVCSAIEASIVPTGKRRYIRFYARRTPADKWEMVKFGW